MKYGNRYRSVHLLPQRAWNRLTGIRRHKGLTCTVVSKPENLIKQIRSNDSNILLLMFALESFHTGSNQWASNATSPVPLLNRWR